MSKVKYVLGVDGGGTKTHCALYNIDDHSIDIMELGTLNHEELHGGFDELAMVLKNMIAAILERNNACLDELHKCVFGIGGVDTKKQHSIISEIIKDIGVTNFHLCNDAYLGVKAGCANGFGVCAINGSGYSVAGIDPLNNTIQIGGQGHFTSDRGGGHYLVPETISRVYNFLYKSAEPTLLTSMMFNTYSIPHKDEFMEIVMLNIMKDHKLNYKKISQLLYLAANEGDSVATSILVDAGIEYERSINGALVKLDFSDSSLVEIVLAGSQFVKCENTTTIDTIKSLLEERCYPFKTDVKILSEPCVAGAVIWALDGIVEKHKVHKLITSYMPLLG